MATATKDSTAKDTQNGSVRVEIFDQAYNLRGSDPEYISKLAEYVDTKMRAVAQPNTIDTVPVGGAGGAEYCRRVSSFEAQTGKRGNRLPEARASISRCTG